MFGKPLDRYAKTKESRTAAIWDTGLVTPEIDACQPPMRLAGEVEQPLGVGVVTRSDAKTASIQYSSRPLPLSCASIRQLI